MRSHQLKAGVFVLEGLNALATALYFNYLFFHMREEFGFTNQGNLALCALNGLVYMFAAWYGGWYGQRRGYFRALRLAFAVMALALLAGSRSHTVGGLAVTMVTWTLGMCFSWPNLEALISERAAPRELPRLIGIYNVTWATCTACANFIGGGLMEKLGARSTFLVPAGLHLVQLGLLVWVQRGATRAEACPADSLDRTGSAVRDHEHPRSPIPPATFLKIAWVANPFAYIAINALVPVIPRLAERFALTPMWAGIFCSVWFFARAVSFFGLWQWTGWHYRFRWLVGAYLGMIASLMVILVGSRLWMLLLAQVVFGCTVGLIYYSSLFYSMDVGENKGEHGGFHESALGAGIFAGPALGAVSLRFFPESPNINAWAITFLLVAGLSWMTLLRHGRRPEATAAADG